MATAPSLKSAAPKESIYAWEGKDKTGRVVRGEIRYDPVLLRNAAAGADTAGSAAFDLGPGGSMALVLRPLPAAAGQSIEVMVSVTSTTTTAGAVAPVQAEVSGSGRIEVRSAP